MSGFGQEPWYKTGGISETRQRNEGTVMVMETGIDIPEVIGPDNLCAGSAWCTLLEK